MRGQKESTGKNPPMEYNPFNFERSHELSLIVLFQVCVVLPAAHLHSDVQRLHVSCRRPGKRWTDPHISVRVRPPVTD